MKIIVNKGFEHLLYSIIVYKNCEKISESSNKEYCVFDADEGDVVDVKLKAFDMSHFTIASFKCEGNDDTVYIHPTKFNQLCEIICFRYLIAFI